MRAGYSKSVSEFMASSCSSSTIKQYNTYIKRWLQFCRENGIHDPCKVEVFVVVKFIFSLYNQGVSYSGCNTARSALSLILNTDDRLSVGSHPMVVRILKAICNAKPPLPKYDTVWDATLVLNLFNSWHDNSDLSLQYLSFKLVALLALTTAQRVQTLSNIRISHITGSNSKEIFIATKLKTSGPNRIQPSLLLTPYTKNKKLCVVRCLNSYIARTASLRSNEDFLFVSFQKPYHKVCSQSLSRWLKSVLELACVDVTKFKAHSFRHVSTSKAKTENVNMDVIFSRAGWSKGSLMFAKFYNKPIDERYRFSEAVLS